MKIVNIKQVKSLIGQSKKKKRTMEALGLKKINSSVHHLYTSAIAGMIKQINHLTEVSYDELKEKHPEATLASDAKEVKTMAQ